MNNAPYKPKICLFLFILLIFPLVSCDILKIQSLTTSAKRSLNREDYPAAIKKYKQLIVLQPENFHHQWNLGVAYAKNGELKKAKGQSRLLRKDGKVALADQLDDYILKKTIKPDAEIMLELK